MRHRSRRISEHQQREWLARNVRARRRALGMSMRAASERVGMHLRQWQKIEGNSTNLTLDTMWRLSEALGVDIVDLMSAPLSAGAR